MAGGTVIRLKSQTPKASFLRITSKPQPNLNLHHRLLLIPTLKNKKDNKICRKNRKKALIGCKINSKISPKVPVKDQAPMAKAVRQMGYYFDYHQWNEERNKNPQQRARPDAKKKKIKKLNLKGMK